MTAARTGWHPGRWVPPGPVGRISVATLVAGVGSGAWYTCWAIFATHSIGLTPDQLGLALTVAGLIGLAIGGPIGYLADRFGTRETLVLLSLLHGVAVLGYLLVHGALGFCLVACVAVTAERTVPGLRVALISGLSADGQRLRGISATVVAAHIGVACGAALGALVLYLDSRTAYVALICLYSVALMAFSFIVRGVPHVASLRERRVRRRALVVRDRPFLVVVALGALLALNWGMLGTGVPLWLTHHTSAPTWIMGGLTTLNAVGVVLFQNRVSGWGATVGGAARLAVWCGVALAVSCALFAATYHRAGAAVIVLLLAAALVHLVGELLFVASGWGLAVGLAPEDAHGEYQGAYGTGPAAALMLAPALMALLVVDWSWAGWLALGGLFLVGGLPTVGVSRWALRSGPSRGAAVPAPDAVGQTTGQGG